jgi:hypothetical protein
VRGGGDEPDAGRAAGGEVAEEGKPASAGFRGGDLPADLIDATSRYPSRFTSVATKARTSTTSPPSLILVVVKCVIFTRCYLGAPRAVRRSPHGTPMIIEGSAFG